MTTVIILGEDMSKTKKKGIEFHFLLNGSLDAVEIGLGIRPKDYNYIELICRRYDNAGDFDIMFAYNDPKCREEGTLFLGKFNDGIIL